MGRRPVETGTELQIDIQFFYKGRPPTIDTDNLAKPIQDALEEVIYADDRLIMKTRVRKRNIERRYSIPGTPIALLLMMQKGAEFVYIQVDYYQDKGSLP